jgi:tripartite-type tricarboxylate transporter receptor subunit TctC
MMKPLFIRVAILWAVVAAAAFAQEYPSKSVRVVVPWAAGGSTDSISRILAAKLTEYTGQQFIIDNRAGATGTIGHALVSKSPPDGYTLLIGSNSTFAIAPHLYKTLQYDNDASFAPIELLAVSPQILSVHPSIPAKNVKELIALAKAQPGALVFSSAGPGSTSHLATELLMNTAGIKMIHVPYKGGGPSAQALLGGETMLSFVDVITALPFAKAGRLRPLAASTIRRSAMMPDLPTISESGLKGFESSTSFAAFAPAGTSREIVAKLNKEISRALNAADVKEKLFNQGIETVGGTPEEFVAYNKAESAKWGKVIREQGIKIE